MAAATLAVSLAGGGVGVVIKIEEARGKLSDAIAELSRQPGASGSPAPGGSPGASPRGSGGPGGSAAPGGSRR